MWRLNHVLVALFALLICGIGHADEPRSLYWQSLVVRARLDGDAVLHVTEKHTMVFDGAWNGGERRFRIGRGQSLKFIGLSEIDAGANGRKFVRGSLDDVGEYRLFGADLLRWRSRLPSDPPFAHAVRTYELEYELSGVLAQSGQTYVLDHDFAFPDRSGPIEQFSATLELDPVWQPIGAFVPDMHRSNLAPGESVVQRISLHYAATGHPHVRNDAAFGATTAPPPQSPQLAAVLLGMLAMLVVVYVWLAARRERARGRFEPAAAPADINAEWLRQHVFIYPPEVVGAAWDRDISTPEVAAVLARMTLEGKLASRVQSSGRGILKHDVLHLEQRVALETLPDFEQQLVRVLFFAGPQTDTDLVQEHYRKSGLDLRRLIKPQIDRCVEDVLGKKARLPMLHWLLTAVALVVGGGIFGVLAIRSDNSEFMAILVGVVTFFGVLAAMSAWRYQRECLRLRRSAVTVLAYVAVMLAALGWILIARPFGLSSLQCVGLAIFTAGLLNSIYNATLCRETPATVALRRTLAAGRRFFATELRSAAPQLKDEWLPYLLAFGLDKNVDHWFSAHGATGGAAGSATSSFAAHRSSGSTSTAAWTGGGGAFGGAGASGSWVAAVGGIAAGVSSSSSSGSSGGGGGSSGGGGGGGW